MNQNLLLLSFCFCLFAGCETKTTSVVQVENKVADQKEIVRQLVSAEDLILDLTPQLQRLALDLKKGGSFQFSKALTAKSFSSFEDPLGIAQPVEGVPGLRIGSFDPSQFESQKIKDPWAPLNAQVSEWGSAKFGVKSGHFVDNVNRRFEMQTVFAGKCVSNSNEHIGVKAAQVIEFERNTDNNWRPVAWKQKSFQITKSTKRLFENITQRAIPKKTTHGLVTRSFHEEYLINVIKTGITPVYDKKYLPFADADMNHATPSVSVVDLNEDGWDDLFVTARWGPPIYLQNMTDGTFDDRTKAVGINARGLVNCSAFVDLDNDGDQDVILGRAMEPRCRDGKP